MKGQECQQGSGLKEVNEGMEETNLAPPPDPAVGGEKRSAWSRHATSAAAADTPGPSYSAHHSPEYVHASSREIAGVMDAICSLVATQVAQDQRLAQCHSMLQQIMTHLGLPRVPDQREEPTAVASASLDVLAAAAATTDAPPP